MVRVPDALRRDAITVCKRMHARGLVAGTDGNVSVRISKNHLLATPTGMSKGSLQVEDLVVCDLEGRQLDGKRRLTTEIKIHIAAYTLREDVCAIVHAHPPYATAFAVAGTTPSEHTMPEAYIAVGKVALAPYGTPSTDELVENIRPALRDHDAVLLANHGAMTTGRDVVSAYHRMEALEQLCLVTYLARQLGGPQLLGAGEIAKLDAIRGVYGGVPRNVPCFQCGYAPEAAVKPNAPTTYVEPHVHWPGNPPVRPRPSGAMSLPEAQARDLVRRTLSTLPSE